MRSSLAGMPLAITLGLVAAAGCHKAPPPNAGLDDMHAALGSAGLKLEGFAPADGHQCASNHCLGGRIEGLDALECEYADEAAARAAKKHCEAWIAGAVTGVAIERGRVLLVLADRAHADPNGKTIHKISQTFLGKTK
jgi:hypothetical protein